MPIGYLTPNQFTPTSFICGRLRIPNDEKFLAAVMGAILDLTRAYSWEKYGTMEPEQAARLALDMYDDFRLNRNWCMIGAIFPYASATPPPNTLLCDGSIYNRVDYPDLYAALDAAFIIDADSFSVPMLAGYVPIGAGAEIPNWGVLNVGDSGGQYEVTLSEGQMPNHYHTTPPHAHGESIAVPTIINGGIEAPAAAATGSTGITGTASPSTNTAGDSEPHDNVQPFVALNFCIVAK